MTTRLRNLITTRVALVDRGSNPKADIVLFKRDVAKGDPGPGDVHVPGTQWPPTNKKKGWPPMMKADYSADQRKAMAGKKQALPDGSFPIANTSDLKNAIQAFGRAGNKAQAKSHIIARAKALGAADQLPGNWNVSKGEEGNMPFDKDALPDEVRKHLEELESERDEAKTALEAKDTELKTVTDELEKLKPPEKKEEEIIKGLPEEIRKRLEVAEAKAADAVAKADAEVAKREEREAVAKAEGWKGLGLDPTKFGPLFHKVEKADADAASALETALKAMAEQVKTSDLFAEFGKEWGDGAGPPISKLDALAMEKVSKGEFKTKEEAMDAVLLTPEGAKLYEEYAREVK